MIPLKDLSNILKTLVEVDRITKANPVEIGRLWRSDCAVPASYVSIRL